MTTRGELRELVRQELNDEGTTRLWSDARLDRWIVEAVRWYGREFPRERSVQLATVAGQAEYALPADWNGRDVWRVEHPPGVPRAPLGASAGPGTEADGAEPPAYEVYGGALALRPAPAATGEVVVVRYGAGYPEPSADGEVLATPDGDDDLLVLFVCGRALRWLDVDEAKRQRFERTRGVGASAVAQAYEEELRRRAAQRRRPLRSGRLVAWG